MSHKQFTNETIAEEISAAFHSHMSQEAILNIVKEVQQYLAKIGIEWEVRGVSHLYLIRDPETYVVRYDNGVEEVFCREAWTEGQLVPATSWSYWAKDDFADTHKEDDKQIKELLKGDGPNT